MKMDQLYQGDQYKVLKVKVPAGGRMPRHYATSDAFVLVVRGTAELEFNNSKLLLQPGMEFLIPCRKPHALRITSEFEAYIVLGPAAEIEMVNALADRTQAVS